MIIFLPAQWHILVPRLGIEPVRPAVTAWSLNAAEVWHLQLRTAREFASLCLHHGSFITVFLQRAP